MTSPYRTHVKAGCARASRWSFSWRADAEVVVAVGLFWLASVARVVGAVVGGETFGAEPTLALVAVVGVLALVVARLRRRARGEHAF